MESISSTSVHAQDHEIELIQENLVGGGEDLSDRYCEHQKWGTGFHFVITKQPLDRVEAQIQSSSCAKRNDSKLVGERSKT